MLSLKYLLITLGITLLVGCTAFVIYNLYRLIQYQRSLGLAGSETPVAKPELDWKRPSRLAVFSILAILFGSSIALVPSGMGGVRVSQFSGAQSRTLYPGIHFVKPLLEYVVIYDLRDQVLSTASTRDSGKLEVLTKDNKKPEVFIVQAREGLPIGLAITVRYHLDPHKLDYIQSNLPQPVEVEIVPPVVSSVFREVVPNYTMRELFASRREEIRQIASDKITQKLAADGVVVKEVMVRDIQLPAEYAKGLEGLLLKEQENEGLIFETEMKLKQVRIAELEAEALKVRAEKRAEGDARVRVLQAKSEADAMQYTLPLKEKQIQQTRLEAEAQKESTVKNAEAQAQAKIIDSKAEMERRNLMADSEARRIRITASADTERMQSEATLLKQNPLLINKIIAERLSDKLQIMMVPSDGKFFFNDVLKSGNPVTMASQAAEADPTGDNDPPAPPLRKPTQRAAGMR